MTQSATRANGAGATLGHTAACEQTAGDLETLRTLIAEVRVGSIRDSSAEQQLVVVGNHIVSIQHRMKNTEGIVGAMLGQVVGALSLAGLQLNQRVSTQQVNSSLHNLAYALGLIQHACGETATAAVATGSASGTTSSRAASAPPSATTLGQTAACQQTIGHMGSLRALISQMRTGSISDASAEGQLATIGTDISSVEKRMSAQEAPSSALREVLDGLNLASLQLSIHLPTGQLRPYLQTLDSDLQRFVRSCSQLTAGVGGAASGSASTAGSSKPASEPVGCFQAAADLVPWSSTEQALTTGQIGDQHAESNIINIQQQLNLAPASQSSGLTARLEAVNNAMGDLGGMLNENASVQQVKPLLSKVDAAIVAVRQYCGG